MGSGGQPAPTVRCATSWPSIISVFGCPHGTARHASASVTVNGEKMLAEVGATQYAQLDEFVSALSNRDTDTLMIKFNLSAPVISEIFEALLV